MSDVEDDLLCFKEVAFRFGDDAPRSVDTLNAPHSGVGQFLSFENLETNHKLLQITASANARLTGGMNKNQLLSVDLGAGGGGGGGSVVVAAADPLLPATAVGHQPPTPLPDNASSHCVAAATEGGAALEDDPEEQLTTATPNSRRTPIGDGHNNHAKHNQQNHDVLTVANGSIASTVVAPNSPAGLTTTTIGGNASTSVAFVGASAILHHSTSLPLVDPALLLTTATATAASASISDPIAAPPANHSGSIKRKATTDTMVLARGRSPSCAKSVSSQLTAASLTTNNTIATTVATTMTARGASRGGPPTYTVSTNNNNTNAAKSRPPNSSNAAAANNNNAHTTTAHPHHQHPHQHSGTATSSAVFLQRALTVRQCEAEELRNKGVLCKAHYAHSCHVRAVEERRRQRAKAKAAADADDANKNASIASPDGAARETAAETVVADAEDDNDNAADDGDDSDQPPPPPPCFLGAALCPYLHIELDEERPLSERVCCFHLKSKCMRDTCGFFHGDADRLKAMREELLVRHFKATHGEANGQWAVEMAACGLTVPSCDMLIASHKANANGNGAPQPAPPTTTTKKKVPTIYYRPQDYLEMREVPDSLRLEAIAERLREDDRVAEREGRPLPSTLPLDIVPLSQRLLVNNNTHSSAASGVSPANNNNTCAAGGGGGAPLNLHHHQNIMLNHNNSSIANAYGMQSLSLMSAAPMMMPPPPFAGPSTVAASGKRKNGGKKQRSGGALTPPQAQYYHPTAAYPPPPQQRQTFPLSQFGAATGVPAYHHAHPQQQQQYASPNPPSLSYQNHPGNPLYQQQQQSMMLAHQHNAAMMPSASSYHHHTAAPPTTMYPQQQSPAYAHHHGQHPGGLSAVAPSLPQPTFANHPSYPLAHLRQHQPMTGMGGAAAPQPLPQQSNGPTIDINLLAMLAASLSSNTNVRGGAGPSTFGPPIVPPHYTAGNGAQHHQQMQQPQHYGYIPPAPSAAPSMQPFGAAPFAY